MKPIRHFLLTAITATLALLAVPHTASAQDPGSLDTSFNLKTAVDPDFEAEK